MKKQLLRLNVQRTLRANTAQRRTRPFSDVRTAGILYCSDSPGTTEAVQGIRQQLEACGIQTTLLEFREKQPDSAGEDSNSFSPKDFSLWGSLRNTNVESFIRQEFDYLFSADRLLHPAVEFVLAASQARCRAGISSDESNPFLDVMIQSDGQPEQILNELLNLTKKLQ